MIDIDFATVEQSIEDGSLRVKIRSVLIPGFREMHMQGMRLPPSSHYATQLAERMQERTDRVLPPAVAFDLYQEILLACEEARKEILGDDESQNPASGR